MQFQQKSGEQFYNLNEQCMLGLRCLGVVWGFIRSRTI
jgi:hypothetical protein